MTARAIRPPRLFYGWYIAATGFVSQLLLGVLIFHSFGAYVTLMQADFGWDRTTFSLAFAVQRIESGLLGPLQGWVVDRYGPRLVMLFGLALLAAGFFLLSAVQSRATFYLAFLLIAIGSSLGSFLSLVVAIVNWFRRRRSLAVGMISTGFAAGGLFATPAALAIEGLGWRAAAFASGLLVLAIAVPLAFVVRHRPEDHGLLPDGAPSRRALAGDPDDPDEDGMERGLTIREALRTPAFWYISFGQASALLVIGALMVHLVVFVDEDLGFGLGLAAFAITIQTLGQIAGQLLGAFLGDRWPKRPLIVCALLGHSLAIFLLALSSSGTLWLVYLAAAINGTAWGLRAPLLTAIRADYFGRRSFGMIMGFSSLVIMLGMITGPTLAGVMYDRTGSYQAGFLALALGAALGSMLFVLARPPRAGAGAAGLRRTP